MRYINYKNRNLACEIFLSWDFEERCAKILRTLHRCLSLNLLRSKHAGHPSRQKVKNLTVTLSVSTCSVSHQIFEIIMSMLARGKAIAPRLCKRFGGIRSSNRTISLYKKNTLPSFKDHAMQVLFPTTSPLEQKYSSMPASEYEKEDVAGNHLGRQQNHIWSRDEIEMLLADQPRHKPQSFSDHTMKQLVNKRYLCNFCINRNFMLY